MDDIDETVIFLMREYKWEYEYTVDLVMNLSVEKLNKLIEETLFQKKIDRYEFLKGFAMICATLANMNRKKSTRRVEIKDFIGKFPEREKVPENIRDLAEKSGIEIPQEGNNGEKE